MSGPVEYVPDRAGMGQLARGPEMAAVMLAVANVGADYARSIAPTATGKYAQSFHVLPATVYVGRESEPRAGAFIVNTDIKAAWIEWHDGAHVLARAARVIDGRRHGNAGARKAITRDIRRESARRRKRASQP